MKHKGPLIKWTFFAFHKSEKSENEKTMKHIFSAEWNKDLECKSKSSKMGIFDHF